MIAFWVLVAIGHDLPPFYVTLFLVLCLVCDRGLFWRRGCTDVRRRDSEYILKAAEVGAGNQEAVRKSRE